MAKKHYTTDQVLTAIDKEIKRLKNIRAKVIRENGSKGANRKGS